MRQRLLNRFIQALDHAVLSLMWLALSMPLVTVPAATAALFEVARQRAGGEDPVGWRAFLTGFRRHLGRALAVGYAWAAVGLVLVADLAIVGRMTGPLRTGLLVAMLALLLLYALGSVALFPVLVSVDARPHRLLRTTVLVALTFPGRGMAAVATVVAAVLVVWTVPLAVLAAPSLVAAALQRLYRGALHRAPVPAAPQAPHLAGHPRATRPALS